MSISAPQVEEFDRKNLESVEDMDLMQVEQMDEQASTDAVKNVLGHIHTIATEEFQGEQDAAEDVAEPGLRDSDLDLPDGSDLLALAADEDASERPAGDLADESLPRTLQQALSLGLHLLFASVLEV